jgi:AraC family transcriptional regulator of adaptative response / DNA-3-methyladenine glycosylase II
VKLILLGTVDTEGVSGLASRLGYSERQLHRVLMAEVGTGALALARAQRAQTARLLLETTDLPVTHVAFAAGFASVRQFNDTVRSVFARTPSELRRAVVSRDKPGRNAGGRYRTSNATAAAGPGGVDTTSVPGQTIALRLAYRKPFAAKTLLDFLGSRAIPGIEAFEGGTYTRTLRLPNGEGVVALTPEDGYVNAVFALEDLRDLTAAVARCRHLCNLDSDPVAVDEALSKDPMLRPLVRRLPGIRVPGTADGFELATRALIGQQVSVTGARTIAGRLVQAAGTPIKDTRFGVTHTFPSPSALAELGARSPEIFPMPAGRRRALIALAESVADGKMIIDPGADPEQLDAQLVAMPGIGPWTSSYIRMRALGDPDAFMPTDLGIKRAAAALGQPDDPLSLTKRAERWRPWRSYALCHLWSSQSPAETGVGRQNTAVQGGKQQGPAKQGRGGRRARTGKGESAA